MEKVQNLIKVQILKFDVFLALKEAIYSIHYKNILLQVCNYFQIHKNNFQKNTFWAYLLKYLNLIIDKKSQTDRSCTIKLELVTFQTQVYSSAI